MTRTSTTAPRTGRSCRGCARSAIASRRPFDALDLGCGTGRYFCALHGVRTLVGLDASAAMLAQARHPLHEDRIAAGGVTLVQGDLLGYDFGADRVRSGVLDRRARRARAAAGRRWSRGCVDG